jgi:hypothetical protein
MFLVFIILHKLTRKQANQRYLNSKELIKMKNYSKDSIQEKKDAVQQIALSNLSIEQASNDLDDIVSILFDLNDALIAKTKNNKNDIDLIDVISMKCTEMNYLFNQLSDISTNLVMTKQQISSSLNTTGLLGDDETNSIKGL